MHRFSIRAALLAAAIVAGLAAAAPTQAGPPGNSYLVTPLVSDNPSLAPTVDPNVHNAWGLTRSATSPWWISDNGTDMTSIYTGAGVLVKIGGLNRYRRESVEAYITAAAAAANTPAEAVLKPPLPAPGERRVPLLETGRLRP